MDFPSEAKQQQKPSQTNKQTNKRGGLKHTNLQTSRDSEPMGQVLEAGALRWKRRCSVFCQCMR